MNKLSYSELLKRKSFLTKRTFGNYYVKNVSKNIIYLIITALPDTSYCIRDISRFGFGRRRRNSKTCAAVLERSGWSPVAITKPSGLSEERLKM